MIAYINIQKWFNNSVNWCLDIVYIYECCALFDARSFACLLPVNSLPPFSMLSFFCDVTVCNLSNDVSVKNQTDEKKSSGVGQAAGSFIIKQIKYLANESTKSKNRMWRGGRNERAVRIKPFTNWFWFWLAHCLSVCVLVVFFRSSLSYSNRMWRNFRIQNQPLSIPLTKRLKKSQLSQKRFFVVVVVCAIEKRIQ